MVSLQSMIVFGQRRSWLLDCYWQGGSVISFSCWEAAKNTTVQKIKQNRNATKRWWRKSPSWQALLNHLLGLERNQHPSRLTHMLVLLTCVPTQHGAASKSMANKNISDGDRLTGWATTFFSRSHFKHTNGVYIPRLWVLYSPSTGAAVFCMLHVAFTATLKVSCALKWISVIIEAHHRMHEGAWKLQTSQKNNADITLATSCGQGYYVKNINFIAFYFRAGANLLFFALYPAVYFLPLPCV